MSLTSYFSPDYATARERFIAAAGNLGARRDSYRFNAKGPTGEPLTMDVASFGDPDPEGVVIVSSGLHGVEGFFGSAVQLAWLMTQGSGWSPSPRTGLVMVHALNPFGLAWRRRWNENNVDLNRNFLDDRRFLHNDLSYQESQAVYARLSPFLNPVSPPSRWELYSLKAAGRVISEGLSARSRMRNDNRPPFFALKAIRNLGLLELQKTLPVGQYEHPTGLFYGGDKEEETTRIVRERLPQWVAGAGKVVHVDFHTGLGNYADYRLLIIDEKGSEGERRVAKGSARILSRLGMDRPPIPPGEQWLRISGTISRAASTTASQLSSAPTRACASSGLCEPRIKLTSTVVQDPGRTSGGKAVCYGIVLSLLVALARAGRHKRISNRRSSSQGLL